MPFQKPCTQLSFLVPLLAVASSWIFYSATAWVVFGHWQQHHHPQQRHSSSTTRCFYRPPSKETFNASDIDTSSSSSSSSSKLSNSQQQQQQQYQGGTLGDIMSPTRGDDELLFQDGLVTSEAYSLAAVYGIDNPLDRMAVTANGNLQRLFSSYYDAPVEVILDYCNKDDDENDDENDEEGSSSVWDRCVHLAVWNQTFCTAESKVLVHDRECQRLVESGQVGLGQLFRFLNILPEFALQAAGPSADGGFWRNYTLTSSMVTCSIRETFCPNVWELKQPQQRNSDDADVTTEED
jgi:chorismate-pyruvate lyase